MSNPKRIAVHQTFLCPNCLKPAEKDAPLSLLLSNLQDPAALSYGDAKTLPAPLRRLRQCPSCSGTIDLPALVAGRLDYRNWGLRLGPIVGAASFAALLSLQPPVAPAIAALLAALIGLIAWFTIGTAERSWIATYRKTID